VLAFVLNAPTVKLKQNIQVKRSCAGMIRNENFCYYNTGSLKATERKKILIVYVYRYCNSGSQMLASYDGDPGSIPGQSM
jgi:hypothetical protein